MNTAYVHSLIRSAMVTLLLAVSSTAYAAELDPNNVTLIVTGPPTDKDIRGKIILTDENLRVIHSHSPIYRCSTTDLPEWNIRYDECFLMRNGTTVYSWDGVGPAYFAPGYSMPTPNNLYVDIPLYGKGE